MRRTLLLIALVVAGAIAVLVTEPPPRRTGQELARGPRVFRTSPGGIRGIELTLGGRRLVAERTHEGWSSGGAPVAPSTREALHELATCLAGLRAVDAFRTTSFAGFGLDPPNGLLVLATPRGPQRLALGSLNAAGSTLYARRDDEQRVLQIGVYLASVLERVLRPPSGA
jgi:hypothetical protein